MEIEVAAIAAAKAQAKAKGHKIAAATKVVISAFLRLFGRENCALAGCLSQS